MHRYTLGLSLLLLLNIHSVFTANQQPPEIPLHASQDSLALDEEAMKLMREGYQLYAESTVESLRAGLTILERAYSITLKTGNKRYQALALIRMSDCAYRLGEVTKAVTYYRELLRLYDADSNQYGVATVCASLGDIYAVLGEKEKALSSYQKAESLFKVTSREKARVLYRIGKLQTELHDKAAAAVNYRRALAVYAHMVMTEANEFVEVGKIYAALGDSKKALFHLGKALEMFKGLGNYRREEAATLIDIATILSADGLDSEALNRYFEALTIQYETGDQFAEADTLGRLMAFYQKNGKASLAIWYGKQSVNLYQSLRADIRSLDKESHRSFVASVESNYRLLAVNLIRQGRLAEALQVLVRFKDQNFFDVIRGSDRARPPATLVLDARESKLATSFAQSARALSEAGDKLSLVNLKIGDSNPSVELMEQQKLLESKFAEAANSLRRLLGHVEAELSTGAGSANAVTMTDDLVEMQSALRDLKRATGETDVALYTLLADEDYDVLLVTPDDLKLASRRGRAAVIKRTASQLSDLLRSPQFDPRLKAKELFDEIFEPLQRELATLKPDTLLWSLDANLRYIPMAALFDGKRYLVERYQHVLFTRNDKERLTAAPTRPWTRAQGLGTTQEHLVEVLGDKIKFRAVPGVETELEGIFGRPGAAGSGVLKGNFLLNKDFTANALKAAARQGTQVLHIASHFRFLPGTEDASFLLLGDGGTLSLAEMQTTPELFAGIELLVLSACDTGTNTADASGREIDGFSEMAQRLGARSVIATLWRIADVNTPDLMIEFYRQQQSPGGTKAKALQNSQLKQLYRSNGSSSFTGCAVLNQVDSTNKDIKRPYPADAPCLHPYYWSGFVLISNGR